MGKFDYRNQDGHICRIYECNMDVFISKIKSRVHYSYLFEHIPSSNYDVNAHYYATRTYRRIKDATGLKYHDINRMIFDFETELNAVEPTDTIPLLK